ncbi:MAG: T9SS type A sorting domain-containing protein [Chitinophagales bacterium]|nr:T9SS type A sorting domain-containing protein [Chitinophagales bacterium]
MKTKPYFLLLLLISITVLQTNAYPFHVSGLTTSTNNQSCNADIHAAKADVTLTTSSESGGDINQGSTSVIVYAVKMKVETADVTVNNIKFTLSGNHDSNDLTTVSAYFNPSSPDLTGASFLNSTAATFAAPHTYSLSINRTLTAGTSGYFIVTVNVSNTATDNHTVQVNGATDPVIFGFTASVILDDQQSNKANAFKIQAADVTLTSSSVSAMDVNQGTVSVIVYSVKMSVATEPVTANNITFTLSRNHDNNDLSTVSVYFNPSSPDLTGASFLNSTAAAFAAPHTYILSINRTIAAGDHGYFIVTVNVSNTATDNHTVQVNGDTDPVIFGFATAPNVDDQQSNKAKAQKIQAADVTLTTSSVGANDVNQGAISVIVYAVKMAVATEPVTANNITFTLSGNHDNNDLSTVSVYFNPSSPDLTGASFLNSTAATFAAPHTYTLSINRTIAAGDHGYFIVTVNVSNTATDNHTVQVNGDTDPVIFGFTTAPNVDDQQSNKAKAQKIQAADVTLTTSSISAGNILQGSVSNIIYAVKMVVVTEPVTANNITFTLSGTHDENDLTTASVYFNPSSPDLTGASFLNSTAATFAAPHTYTLSINRTIAEGDHGYFIITVNVSSTASTGKTVTINGSKDPVLFSFTTVPNITDNQSNKAGVKTIKSSQPKIENLNTVVLNGIYPNPAAALFNYSISAKDNQSVTIELTDQYGRIVVSNNLLLSQGVNNLSLNVSDFANGIYYLVATDEAHTLRLKKQLVIQH